MIRVTLAICIGLLLAEALLAVGIIRIERRATCDVVGSTVGRMITDQPSAPSCDDDEGGGGAW